MTCLHGVADGQPCPTCEFVKVMAGRRGGKRPGGTNIPTEPSLWQKGVNLVAAGARHIWTGMRTLPLDVVQARLAMCSGCEMNSGTPKAPHCRLCGCGAGLPTKATWAEQSCPHPGGDRWDVATLSLPKIPVRFLTHADLVNDALALAGKLPPDVSGVAGVPRSGMIAAAAIAAQLHLPLWSAGEDGPLTPLPGGWRGSTLRKTSGPLAIVEDTVYGGGAMTRLRKAHGPGHLYCAVYVRGSKASAVDHYGRIDDLQFSAWNWSNNVMLVGAAHRKDVYRGGIACDMDGVLCEEPRVPDADDGQGEADYRSWLANAAPLNVPRRFPVPLVVTGRIERYRAETETWFAKHGIRVQKLVMSPHATMAERNRAQDVAVMKGEAFAGSACGVFMESDARQCPVIQQISGKVVVQPSSGKVWQ